MFFEELRIQATVESYLLLLISVINISKNSIVITFWTTELQENIYFQYKNQIYFLFTRKTSIGFLINSFIDFFRNPYVNFLGNHSIHRFPKKYRGASYKKLKILNFSKKKKKIQGLKKSSKVSFRFFHRDSFRNYPEEFLLIFFGALAIFFSKDSFYL